jgi:replicative superfamily II helicase
MLDSFIVALGGGTVKVIDQSKDLAFSEYGIMVDDLPTDEDRAWLEKQIDSAMAQRTNTHTGGIELEDAIMVREISNVKLAARMLIVRRQRREMLDAQMKQSDIQSNGQVQQNSAMVAHQLKMAEAMQNHIFRMDEINLTQVWLYVDSQVKAGTASGVVKQKADADLIQTLIEHEHEDTMQANDAATNGAQGSPAATAPVTPQPAPAAATS